MKIAIHQPNLFPYYPFFQKMQECDLFVILAHCQFEKNNFQNRFNVGDRWHTMSVKNGVCDIVEKQYINHAKDWMYIKKAFPKKQLYRFDFCISPSLCITNVNIINGIKQHLKINTELKFDKPTELKGTDRLIEICKEHGATEYLSGISGKNYLDLSKFSEAGIKVIFQDESKMIKKPIIDFL